MKFSYVKFPLTKKSAIFGTSILKPIIPIKITHKNLAIQYAALIDSGADFCILDAKIGEYLGLNIKSGIKEVFGGIQEGDNAEAFLHEVIINIGGWNYKTTLGFSYNIANHGFCILGQKGFFDIFIVKFDLLKKEIELKSRG
ncbi:MAG: hypothetical protein Q8P80_02095 [Candidatus Levybacteria bacterium]|nr:hypothetical protein [Candidatus Levybacteria bacterium]